MPTLGAGTSWLALAGLGLWCVAFGYALRHLLGLHANRAKVTRISGLCDQLDAKDDILASLRVKLHEEQVRVGELEVQLAASLGHARPTARSLDRHPLHIEPVDDYPPLRLDEDTTVRARVDRPLLDISPVRRLS